MSVQQEHATSETATLTTTESGGVYQSLFDKINLTPVSSIQEIDLWQNSETLADASPDERVTAAIHVPIRNTKQNNRIWRISSAG